MHLIIELLKAFESASFPISKHVDKNKYNCKKKKLLNTIYIKCHYQKKHILKFSFHKMSLVYGVF